MSSEVCPLYLEWKSTTMAPRIHVIEFSWRRLSKIHLISSPAFPRNMRTHLVNHLPPMLKVWHPTEISSIFWAERNPGRSMRLHRLLPIPSRRLQTSTGSLCCAYSTKNLTWGLISITGKESRVLLGLCQKRTSWSSLCKPTRLSYNHKMQLEKVITTANDGYGTVYYDGVDFRFAFALANAWRARILLCISLSFANALSSVSTFGARWDLVSRCGASSECCSPKFAGVSVVLSSIRRLAIFS